MHKLKYFIYDVKTGISNLINWLPIIWKDRNWDHNYIYQILHKKLTLVEKTLRENNSYVGVEQDTHRIRNAIYRLERLIAEDYDEYNVFKKRHNAEWGHSSLNFKNHKLEEVYSRPLTPEEQEQERVDHVRYLYYDSFLKEADKNILFGILKRNIDRWWD